ncbi:MAG: LPS-assembly protein LptD [Bacteroidales bacterium]|nr:LPS-assembly protein LptD [Bacteroidales bacterium]
MAPSAAEAQENIPLNEPDTVLIVNVSDTVPLSESKNALESRVDYYAEDSIRFDMKAQKAFLFNKTDIGYEDINLKADSVVIDFMTNSVIAAGVQDSTGELTGKPVFTQGNNSFTSRRMKYNYRSKKGLVYQVITQDGEGYIHGQRVKYMPNKDVNIRDGKYTTCSHEHPHFEFRFSKAKVVPGNKIVTGPAYFVVEGVPTPLFIPFGLFPNKKGQRSGIVVPTFGESSRRGFYFENGGYYFAINDYMDFKMVGDIYTLGSWALKPQFSYRKRYKFGGNLNFSYAENYLGEVGSPDYSGNKDFEFRWMHNQDPKARPKSRFSANVNVVSSKYNRFNPVNSSQYLSNTFQSSVNYSTSFGGKYFLTGALNHSQNTITREVSMTLPKLTFSVNRFYPLRQKKISGKPKWYENISVNYNSVSENRVNTYDTLLFKENLSRKMKNGLKHSIALSSGAFKVLKHIVWSNSFNYTERWYSQSIRKNWTNEPDIASGDVDGYVKTDTIYGFQTARDFSLSTSLSTTLYGMFAYKRGPVKAIRHVLKPGVSFSFNPDFSKDNYGYYKYYQNEQGIATRYSVFEQNVYGSPPGRKSGNLGFRLSNNLEMKVRAENDTVTGTKKIILLEDLSLSSGYDLAKDSLNLSPLSVTGRTTLFKNLMINYEGNWDPYVLDSAGRRLDIFEWEVNRRIFRPEKHTWRLGLTFRLNSDLLVRERKSGEGTEQELKDVNENPEGYVDWSIPWSLNVSYDFNYTYDIIYKNGYLDYLIEKEKTLIQTLSFSGELNVTPKWKVVFRSGFDFEDHEFTYTSFEVYRDLHCWQMRFNWIPFGFRQSWNFTINIKSSLLQDLKLDKKKDFRDY